MYGAVTSFYGDLYAQYEKQSQSKINRRCIDGSITGCGNCVGYCQYSGHPGFLTSKLRKAHNCLGKGCFYYVEKPVMSRPKPDDNIVEAQILAAAKRKTATMEGMRIMGAICMGAKEWKLNYITISDAYPLQSIAEALSQEVDCKVRFVKLQYSFDNCVKLIMAR